MKSHLSEEMVDKTKAVFAFDIKGKFLQTKFCAGNFIKNRNSIIRKKMEYLMLVW